MFCFSRLIKNLQRLYILEDFPFFSTVRCPVEDEVAALGTSEDKLENFLAKFGVIRR